MRKEKIKRKNIIIISLLILAAVFTTIFIISKVNSDQKQSRGVFVIVDF